MVGINDDEAVLILDNGFAASKFFNSPWMPGIRFSANEVFNGSFRDVPSAKATALLDEARNALSDSPKRDK